MTKLSPVESLIHMIFGFYEKGLLSPAEEEKIKKKIEPVLDDLGSPDKDVIKMRYGLGDGNKYNLDQTAKVFGITRAKVRQVERRSVLKLRQPTKTWRLYEAVLNTGSKSLAEKIKPDFPVELLPPWNVVDPASIPGSDNMDLATELYLGVRARMGLRRLGIRTIGDLVLRTELELLATKNFGETSLEEVREALASKYGFKLRGDV